MIRLIVVAALVLPAQPALALYCTRPDAPSCLTMLGMSDRFTFDMCRSAMLQYQQDVEEFTQCRRREISEVVDELSQAIRKFNDCAQNRYC
jgi:hypothetical protein